MMASNTVKLFVYILMFVVAGLLVWHKAHKDRCDK
jgi:hypothetical protein